MPSLMIRLIGNEDQAANLIDMFHELDGVTCIRQVAHLNTNGGDEDAWLNSMDDAAAAEVHAIEIDAPTHKLAERVIELADRFCEGTDASLEYVSEF